MSPALIVTVPGVAVPLVKVIVTVWLLGVALAVGLTVGVMLSVIETVGLGLTLTLTSGDSVGSGATAVGFLNTSTAAIIPIAVITIKIVLTILEYLVNSLEPTRCTRWFYFAHHINTIG